MAYRFKAGRSIERDARRIAARQLRLAIGGMHAIGDPKSDAAIHKARRHVKKVRALVRLVQPAVGRSQRGVQRRLRALNRLLAPIADGEAVVATVGRLRKRYPNHVSERTLATIRKGLLHRSARVDHRAAANHALRTAVRVLRAERKRVERWRLDADGYRAVASGLTKTVGRARHAMAVAAAYPTNDNYHAWRRRVKDHWFQVRMLERRCAGELLAEQHRLEALDGYLGQHHDCTLLQQVLITEGLLPRDETARTLRLLRQYQRELRRGAHRVAAGIYAETPRQFVACVRRLWRAATAGAPAAEARASLPQAA